jgi:hypothetical protein
LLTRVCIVFLPMLFCGVYVLVTFKYFFSDVFCKTVLVKITTPCQGVVWFVSFKCGNLYTGSLVEHKNTHFDCGFGQTMPIGILSFFSFMRKDEFILICNDKTLAGRKTNCMLTRKLEKLGLKICYHVCAIARLISTQKPQFLLK